MILIYINKKDYDMILVRSPTATNKYIKTLMDHVVHCLLNFLLSAGFSEASFPLLEF